LNKLAVAFRNKFKLFQKSAEDLMRQRLLAKHGAYPMKQDEKSIPQSTSNQNLENELAQLRKNVSNVFSSASLTIWP